MLQMLFRRKIPGVLSLNRNWCCSDGGADARFEVTEPRRFQTTRRTVSVSDAMRLLQTWCYMTPLLICKTCVKTLKLWSINVSFMPGDYLLIT